MAGNPLTDPTWAATTADTIERVVGTIRAKGTNTIVMAARALVYGIIIAVGGVLALVLVLVMATRALQAGFDLFLGHPTSVWLSYLVLGGILCLAGVFSMAKRHATD